MGRRSERGPLRRLDTVVVPWLGRCFARVVAGRLTPGLLAGTGLAVVAMLLVAAVWTVQRPRHEPGAPAAAESTVHVGVGQGQSVPGYIAASQTELQVLMQRPEAAPNEVYALVVLAAYLAPERLTPVLGGVTVTEVYARVPLPKVQTQIVRIPAFRIPDDIRAGMERVADRREQDASEYHSLAGKLSGVDAQEAELRDTYVTEAQLALAEVKAYRMGCACVYAAVVRASPVALEQIAARDEVRAVDPAPEVRRLDLAVFLPPLPEQDMPRPQPSAGPGSPSPDPQPSVPASERPEPDPQPSVSPAPSGSGSPISPSPVPEHTAARG